jgi:uncharacterized membrane protein
MEVLPILLLFILIIIVVNKNNKLIRQLSRIEEELIQLRKQLSVFIKENATEKSSAKTHETTMVAEPVPIKPLVAEPEPPKNTEAYKSLFTVMEDSPPVEPVTNNIVESTIVVKEEAAWTLVEDTTKKAQFDARIPSIVTPVKASFFERHPDMEKFIGENLINKIGIAILVLAIGFFVKYAIDQNWVGPVGRVSIGILCGGILVSLAHRMRNSYRSFSSVLAGGGMAVFYFTITLAYHQFQLFSQTTAFIIMVVITIFAVTLSLLYNKQELAIIALVGGFAAPFLVSDGSGNYKTLFIYLLVLNTGILVIAYNKAWRLLNLLSFIFTSILFSSWLLLLHSDEPAITYKNGFLFATAFYLLYFLINIAHNIKEKKKFIASDFGILLAGTSLYFAAGLYCIIKMHAPELKGLFSASMGIFNLAASYILFRKQKVDTNILYLLIGITLTFISLTAPLQLEGNYITLFWASEAVLLYWLFTKSAIRIIQYSSVLVWSLMLVSLLMDWANLYVGSEYTINIIVNKGFITTLYAATSCYAMFLLRRKELPENKPAVLIPGKTVYRIVAFVLLFAAGALEINYQFNNHYPHTDLNTLYLLLYTIAFISVLTAMMQKIKIVEFKFYPIATLLSLCIVLYLAAATPTVYIQANILTGVTKAQPFSALHFMAHWATALLTASVIYRLIQLIRHNSTIVKTGIGSITWALCAVVVICLSIELYLLSNSIFYSANNRLPEIERVYIKTGLPILWGVCSFIFMWLGMHHKYRTLRIISLSLFTITLLKLFLFDITNIPAGGKIAAFFCLGVLLLIVSFMYQRLKKIIIDNETKVD